MGRGRGRSSGSGSGSSSSFWHHLKLNRRTTKWNVFVKTMLLLSFTTRSTTEIVLESDVIRMIHSLYQDLEKYHGKMLVERVLGLLAAGTDGMNSDDILNLLSCDEELLKDVLVWHEPPKRRLPPLLLARLKHDLGPFLVERGAYGVSLLALYHRYYTCLIFVEMMNRKSCVCVKL